MRYWLFVKRLPDRSLAEMTRFLLGTSGTEAFARTKRFFLVYSYSHLSAIITFADPTIYGTGE